MIRLAVAAALFAAPALAQDTPREPSIPFADHGGIQDWRADGNSTLYLQGRNRQWFRADMASPCVDLPFSETIGFKTNPDGSFDRRSAVIMRGGRTCWVRSMTAVDGPPEKKK
jgi:hypothetical protein